jgi:hypothetical protein
MPLHRSFPGFLFLFCMGMLLLANEVAARNKKESIPCSPPCCRIISTMTGANHEETLCEMLSASCEVAIHFTCQRIGENGIEYGSCTGGKRVVYSSSVCVYPIPAGTIRVCDMAQNGTAVCEQSPEVQSAGDRLLGSFGLGQCNGFTTYDCQKTILVSFIGFLY